jgi:hypothetical protein
MHNRFQQISLRIFSLRYMLHYLATLRCYVLLFKCTGHVASKDKEVMNNKLGNSVRFTTIHTFQSNTTFFEHVSLYLWTDVCRYLFCYGPSITRRASSLFFNIVRMQSNIATSL